MNGPNNKIGWCDFTANPVKGKCRHACPYCYAEAIRKRYKWSAEIEFKPSWFDGRQVDRFIKEYNRFPIIFVGSMHDLFGEWIPSSQIQAVISLCAKKDACRFVFCTKNPKRYQEFRSFRYLDNCILATTVTCQDDEWRIVELLKAECACRMLRIEPMLGPVDLKKYLYVNIKYIKDKRTLKCNSLIDYIVIGGESGPNRRPCKIEGMIGLVKQCQAAGVKVYVKQVDGNYLPPYYCIKDGCNWSGEEKDIYIYPDEEGPMEVCPKCADLTKDETDEIYAAGELNSVCVRPKKRKVSKEMSEWPPELRVRETLKGGKSEKT